MTHPPPADPPQWRAGMAAMAPVALAALPFGMLFGSEAIRQGLSLPEALLMSLTVFAGGSQFLAMGLWSDPAPWLTLALATFVVNLRHVLMSASIAGRMTRFGRWQRPLALFLLADETWAMAERRVLDQPLTPAFYFGVGLTLYVLWSLGTVAGALVGGLIADPAAFGLDFAFPAIFIVLVMGFARAGSALPVILAAGMVAWISERMLGGTWYIILGGLAGITLATLMPGRRPA